MKLHTIPLPRHQSLEIEGESGSEHDGEPDPPFPWKPSNPDRWWQLSLEDPDPSGEMPKRARVLDALGGRWSHPARRIP